MLKSVSQRPAFHSESVNYGVTTKRSEGPPGVSDNLKYVIVFFSCSFDTLVFFRYETLPESEHPCTQAGTGHSLVWLQLSMPFTFSGMS